MSSLKLDTTKRNVARLALVTGSTLAAIIGAQSLVALDVAPLTTASASQSTDSNTQFQFPNSLNTFEGDDDNRVSLQEVSPGVFMIRPSGQVSGSSAPVVAQSSQRRPRSRSSR